MSSLPLEYLLSGIAAIVGSLVTAVGFLFKLYLKLNEKHLATVEKVGQLDGSKKAIKDLTAETLATVHDAITQRRLHEAERRNRDQPQR